MLTNRWVRLAVLGLARLCTGVQFQAIPSIAPLIREDLRINYGVIQSGQIMNWTAPT